MLLLVLLLAHVAHCCDVPVSAQCMVPVSVRIAAAAFLSFVLLLPVSLWPLVADGVAVCLPEPKPMSSSNELVHDVLVVVVHLPLVLVYLLQRMNPFQTLLKNVKMTMIVLMNVPFFFTQKSTKI